MTFLIVMFIFIMQFFFVYIDDFVGKGIPWYIIAELVSYLTANVIPICLPLAILFSCIMAFGNLSERSELTALKATGTSLLRMMRGLMIGMGIVTLLALSFNQFILPNANLKFYTTLFDVTRKKPALNLKEDIFFTEMEDFVIKVKEKNDQSGMMYDVYIREKTISFTEQQVIYADSGYMQTNATDKFLVFNLYHGNRVEAKSPRAQANAESTITYFDSLQLSIDLSSFQMNRTDEGLYKDHYVMLRIEELTEFIDSLAIKRVDELGSLLQTTSGYISFLRDTVAQTTISKGEFIPKPINTDELKRTYIRAISLVRNSKGQLENPFLARFNKWESHTNKARVELNKRLTLPLACFAMMLIGVPLGVIIRKGGIGMPMLFATIVFVVFLVMTKIGESLSKKAVGNDFVNLWMPVLILFPIGIYLINRAAKEKSFTMFNSIANVFKRKSKKADS